MEIDEAFAACISHLQSAYPRVFGAGKVRVDAPWRVVFDLPGSEPNLEPLLFLAHYDVVDVEAGTEGRWTHPPFSAALADDCVWARGAIDDKSVLAAGLEAAEAMLEEGMELRRGLVFAFGGDEEISGRRGAGENAAAFAAAGRRFHAVMDEGAVVAVGMLRVPAAPLALVGIAEKGYADIRIRVAGDEGHAAMPPDRTAAGRLAELVRRVEQRPHRAELIPGVDAFFRALGARSRGLSGLIYRHPRLFRPLLLRSLTRTPASNALVRTTQAVTMLRASEAPNVLPAGAEAVVNTRILPGTSVAQVLEHYRRLCGDEAQVDLVEDTGAGEPIGESSIVHSTYLAIEEAVAEHFPGAVVAPYLVTGSTDSKWYAALSDGLFRFVPLPLESRDLARIHGTDERILVSDYLRMIGFYRSIFMKECVHG